MKKIIASILAIAMVASMFTMVFSANTEAKTNYTEQVDELGELLDTLLEVGPVITGYISNSEELTVASNKRTITTFWTLPGDQSFSQTIASELGRWDIDLPTEGVDIDDLIYDEAEFIAELDKSEAMLAIAAAYGYDSVSALVEDLVLWSAKATPNMNNIFGKKNSYVVDGKTYVKGASNNTVEAIDGSYTESINAVLDYMRANGREAEIPTLVTEYSDFQEIFQILVHYVASAKYFGTGADADYFAPEFNANRTIVYQLAIEAAEDFIAALRAQVAPYHCPYEGAYYAYTFFEEVSEYIYEDAVYNESYGINPWVVTYGPDFDLTSNIGILAGYQWMSFEEVAAYSEKAAQLLTSFQAQLRAAHLFDVTGVLYVEFVEKVEELYETFEALCWELVGGKLASSTAKDYSAVKETFQAIVKLWQLEQLYTLYVEPMWDLYGQSVQNISTMYNLAGQMEMARRILTRIGYLEYDDVDEWYYDSDSVIFDGNTAKFTASLQHLLGLDATAVMNFIANIEANIAALVPAAGQNITAAELAEGLALYKKVGNLLAYYAENAESLELYGELSDLYTLLGDYIPAEVNGDATAEMDFTFYLDPNFDEWVTIIYGAKVVEGNYKDAISFDIPYSLEFAPVAYAYLSLLSTLEEVVEDFEVEVKELNTVQPSLGTLAVTKLYNVIKKYDFLTYRNNYLKDQGKKIDDEDTQLYWYLLTGYASDGAFLEDANSDDAANVDVKFGEGSFLQLVMGDPVGEDNEAYDYAVRNFANFYKVYEDVRDYAKDWGLKFWNGFGYTDKDAKLDFTGDFSILDVTVSTAEKEMDEKIAELEAAAALLCVNVTDRIAMFAWVNEELAEIFELTLDNATYTVNEAATQYGQADKYIDGTLAELAKAMTALNQLVDRYYNNKKGEPVVDRATPAKLEAAFENVKEALYKLFTVKGAACVDAFFAQIETTLAAKVYGNKNSVADVQAALDAHVRSLKVYFPAESEMRPYDYFAWTLKAVSDYNEPANIYFYNPDGVNYFEINFHKAFANAVAAVNSIITGQYPSALRGEAAELDFFAQDILAGINGGKFDEGDWNADNMPLWYALELTQYLADFAAAAKTQHASALQALKVEVLVPVIEEAETIQTAFLSNSVARSLIAAYEEAYNVRANSADGALYIYDADEIKAAAEALTAEVELAKAELGDAVYTVEDVLALIDAAVATAEARATGMNADLKDLRVAANNAKTEISAGDYKQNTHINNVVKAANNVLEALIGKIKLADEELYTPASYEAYEAAYNTLMDVVNVNTEVELTVAEALAAFKAAEAELVLIADATGAMYEAAVAALEAAKAVDGTKYTAESYAAFEAAVAALQSAVDNYASDAELQAAIVNVKVAEVQLVAANVDEVGTLDD